jgi:transcriptional regulator with XRE-family HTH domain|tara:strand:+ start:2987 stop:3277 length:291 start_codon:yes stop_codon:yes gene_type:complete
MDNVVEFPTLGSRVRDERLAWGWTLGEVGEKCGLSKSHIWEIEHDRTDPRASTVVKLADGLKVSVSKLLTGKDDGYDRGYRAALAEARRRLQRPSH